MYKNVKIKTIFAINLLFITVCLALFSVAVLYAVRTVLTENLIEQSKQSVGSLITVQVGVHIDNAIFAEENRAVTQQTFERFFKEVHTEDVIRIKVWNSAAEIIASDDPDLLGKSFPENAEYQEAIDGATIAEIKAPVKTENAKELGYSQLMEVYVPIFSPTGKVIGVVEAYTPVDQLNERIRTTQISLAITIALLALPMIAFFGISFWIFYGKIARTIGKFSKYMSVLGEGNLDEKLVLNSHNEFSDVAVAMNKMSLELKKSLISKAELEKRVKVQTAALNAKVAELEKVNTLMVDRETKMIELKKELADLKGKKEDGGV